jgi:hypothetical protein
MATPTYDLIDSEVLASAASSVTFTSIPGTYRDLILVTGFLGNGGDSFGNIQINSDTGSNYNIVNAVGNGTSASSAAATTTNIAIAGSTTTIRNLSIVQFMDYSVTDKHKSILLRANLSSDDTRMVAARWANTAAVTSIQINAVSNNFAAGSTFYLYGIAG